MNCDQVFDVLTRGPFPTGSPSDHEVELHLLDCNDCRQLAEALRPAIELFEEAVTIEESRTLPGYWGSLHTSSDGKIALAEPLGAPRRLSNRLLTVAAERATEIDWWRLSAAVLLGVLLGSWFRSGGSAEPTLMGSNSQASAGQIDLGALGAMKLPAACREKTRPEPPDVAELGWERRPSELSTKVAMTDYACCTQCHRSEGHQARAHLVSRMGAALIAQSCQACHVSTAGAL
jgi:hypothetical protein